ncbi:enoyl-CoA hydratase-related protein [Bradyrhizobium sp. USDA 4502]
MSEVLHVIEDGVAIVTLNRPESMNSLNGALLGQLLELLPKLAGDESVGAVVLTGAGRAFCSGGDVKGMAQATGQPNFQPNFEESAAQLRAKMEISRILREMPKPTIAMLNGAAAGAGLAIALACDLRFAAESARLVTAFVKVGVSGDFGGTYFLTRLVGTAKARELYFSSEPLSAKAAHESGVVNRVYPDAELREATLSYAKDLAKGPRVAVALMKQCLNLSETEPMSQLLDLEARNMTRARSTEDHREAAKAFVEKRAPVFRGR